MLPAIARGVVAPAAEYDGLIGWVLSLMTTIVEVGVGLGVLLDESCPPIASEAVLPGAGFLAWAGRMTVWWAIVAATLGGLGGAWVWYGLGALLGRDRTRWIFEKT